MIALTLTVGERIEPLSAFLRFSSSTACCVSWTLHTGQSTTVWTASGSATCPPSARRCSSIATSSEQRGTHATHASRSERYASTQRSSVATSLRTRLARGKYAPSSAAVCTSPVRLTYRCSRVMPLAVKPVSARPGREPSWTQRLRRLRRNVVSWRQCQFWSLEV